jgi:membrane protease subunit HflC
MKTIWRWVKLAGIVVGVLVIFSFVLSCVYSINQNELGGVTRGGKLISDKPIGPGYHFKLPWIDDIHTIRMSIDKLAIDKLTVKTTDNQFVAVDLNLTYRVSDPFKALFQVGDMGHGGIIDKVVPFVQSRALDVFGQVNALQIVDQKKKLEADILLAVQAPAMDFFGERIEDVQITHLEYSEGFEKNIEKMVQTRNEQVSAQNMLVVRQTEAQQQVAIAKGQADSAAEQADGAKRVAIENAEGAAKQTTLQADANFYAAQKAADAAAYTRKVQSESEAKAQAAIGAAQAQVYESKIKSAGSAEAYANVLRAEASAKWTGGVPVYQFGNGDKGGSEPVVILPQPATK